MLLPMKYTTLPEKNIIAQTAQALEHHGIKTVVVDTKEEAKQYALSLLPKGAEVMNMTSKTLEQTGIAQEILGSGNYQAVRNTFATLDRKKDYDTMQKLGAAPVYAIGSVHAVTKDGRVIVASGSGSQLPAYAYGATHVIWVVGTHKIVENLDEGMNRIYDYVLPLEDARARAAYGSGSNVNKVLIVNKKGNQERITLIFVHEALGF